MTKQQLDLACLAQLPGATPHRLRRLLANESPRRAWQQVTRGHLTSNIAPRDVLASWPSAAADIDRDYLESVMSDLSIEVSCLHDEFHPRCLVTDIDPAPILFRLGSRPDDQLPAVAVIGTRRCTPLGRSVAFELGRDLASAGVAVVSGLALGIDGAAHRGALSVDGAPPLAVAGSGPDVAYPKSHSDLWHLMAERGAIFTEAHIGARPEPWRFPARNRLLAALSDIVVVVESRAAGGSQLTVEQAIRRDISVMAVPGSIRNPAADGTNQLIADGCEPVRHVEDILLALGLSEATNAARRDGGPPKPGPDPGEFADFGAQVVSDGSPALISCLDDGPCTLDEIADRSSRPIPQVLAELDRLIAHGLVKRDGVRFIRGGLDHGCEGHQTALDLH